MAKTRVGAKGPRAAQRSDLDAEATVVLAAAATAEIRRDLKRGLRLLKNEGIHSFEALTEVLPHLRGLAGWAAIRLLESWGAIRSRRSSRFLLAVTR